MVVEHGPVGAAGGGGARDSAPDRSGGALIARAERRRAKAARRTPHALRDIDYLLAVNDEARQGALRFATTDEGPRVAQASGAESIPPLVNLPRLLNAAQAVLEDAESAEDVRLLLDPGASHGGADPRPPCATRTVPI